jgi:hypothetical protein
MEQMMARLLDEIRTNQAKADANLKDMKEEIIARLEAKIDANQEKLEDRIAANNEKFEVLRGNLVSRMDIP